MSGGEDDVSRSFGWLYPLIVVVVEHHKWANLTPIDFCAGLDEAALAATAPGTYGGVRDTLVHIIANEQGYLAVFEESTIEPVLFQSLAFPGFDGLREMATQTADLLITLGRNLTGDVILRGEWQGKPYAMPAAMPLIQTINHGAEHRGHIRSTLSTHGIEPPRIDAWAYDEGTRAEDRGPS
ncbi:MAG: hypothetical protein H0W06_02515 [Chloroflexia bacterium]|nr:hypothetical protein [Chloroflexia bacterium]